ncbi:MAG TPA: hypothetical protein VHC20_05400 [Candidatus Paceibacterota bacterium]|nr:hypothetical protein [Candidatus Paceibacterota bacterium]
MGKMLLAILGFLLLLKISPLGAAVAVVTCVIKCMFRGRAFSHLAALVMHDVLLLVARGIWWALCAGARGIGNLLRMMSRGLTR